MSWQKKFIEAKSHINRGDGELTRLRQLVMTYVLIDLWLSTKGITLNFIIVGIAAVAILFGYWLFGKAWDKLKLWEAEAEFGNKRNGTLLEILQRVKRLEKRKFK